MNKAVCLSHIGGRTNHEDNFLFNGRFITPSEQKEMTRKRSIHYAESTSANVRFFAVSDGMGGHNAGETASLICVNKLAELEKTVQNCCSVRDVVSLCQNTIGEINAEVCALSRSDRDKRDMGATLVLLIICSNEYAVLNLGDSRAYFFDGEALTQITKDNTEGQRMLDLNLLSKEELRTFPDRKNVTRYIGYGEQGFILKADEYYLSGSDGLFLLCSDGLTDALSDAEISDILCKENNLETAIQILVERAAITPNADNITVVLISTKG